MVWTPNRFADQMPELTLDLRSIPNGPEKSSVLEAAYRNGFTSAYTTRHSGPMARAAAWFRDEFRDKRGKNRYRAADALPLFGPETEFGYIASADAFTAWLRDKAPDAIDWLFQFYQNSGNCVGCSWVEMIQGMQGTRAMDPALREALSYLATMWVYAWRGHCGGGWYGGACASMTIEHGYIFAFPKVLDKYKLGGEQDGENYTTNTWCRGGAPADICAFVDSNGWRFEDGAIFEMGDAVDELKDLGRRKGQFHHGSNTTSGSSRPNVFTSIGGHMQTMFGISWHPLLLAFYEAAGFRLAAGDAWTFNHQTWGSGFSGECADQYWPYGHDGVKVYSLAEVKSMPAEKVSALTLLAGPKPQGAWVVSATGLLKRVEGYGYLPKFKGLPGTGPTPPPTPTPGQAIGMSGDLYVDGTAIRGTVTGTLGAVSTDFIAVPSGVPGKYKLQRRIG